MTTKYVTYQRLSVEDRKRTQHGFDSQWYDIEDYLEKEGGEIVGSFKEFVSGAADSKPELEKAIQMCKDTGATLLIAKLDRLSRKVSQISLLMESDVQLRVALMPNASTFELHIYASLAQQERDMIRDRIKRGLAVVKRNNPEKLSKKEGSKWHRTYTKNKESGLHKQNPSVAAKRKIAEPVVIKIEQIIRLTNANSKEEGLTLEGVANILNSESILTTTGKNWTAASLSSFMKTHNIKYKRKNRYSSNK